MHNKTKQRFLGANISIPEELNWKLKEEAMRLKTTREATIILLLQEALE